MYRNPQQKSIALLNEYLVPCLSKIIINYQPSYKLNFFDSCVDTDIGAEHFDVKFIEDSVLEVHYHTGINDRPKFYVSLYYPYAFPSWIRVCLNVCEQDASESEIEIENDKLIVAEAEGRHKPDECLKPEDRKLEETEIDTDVYYERWMKNRFYSLNLSCPQCVPRCDLPKNAYTFISDFNFDTTSYQDDNIMKGFITYYVTNDNNSTIKYYVSDCKWSFRVPENTI